VFNRPGLPARGPWGGPSATLTMIATKSLHSAPDAAHDGLRILVARFLGRGLEKSSYDVWMANLGPSEELLRQFQRQEVNWSYFSRRYKEEIFTDSEVDHDNGSIKNHGQKFTLRLIKHLATRQNVTLLCHCAEDEKQCHRHLIAKLIEAV
jgi:uncharacterized protein YeaO (DUF488 family)